MIRIKVIAVGKTKEAWINTGMLHYQKILKKYAEMDILEIKEEKIRKSLNFKSVLEKEANRILNSLADTSLGVALDVKGGYKSSEDFAKFFEGNLNRGCNEFTFILGGPLGLSPKVLDACRVKLSLSPMTFTHEMSRIILLEQIYRAFSIIRGGKYHK